MLDPFAGSHSMTAVRTSPPTGRDAAPPASWQGWVSLLARLVLAGVMLWAGLSKITNLDQSVLAVRAYQLLPYEWTQPVGYALPILEVLLGILLLIGLFTRFSAAAVTGLMLAFVVGIASAWARGLSIDCGCFGGGGEVAPEDTNYLGELIRDAGLLALAVWLTIRPRSPWSLDNWLFAPIAPQHSDPDDDSDPSPDLTVDETRSTR